MFWTGKRAKEWLLSIAPGFTRPAIYQPVRRKLRKIVPSNQFGKIMALTDGGRRALIDYAARTAQKGAEPEKFSIANGVKLTPKQRVDLQSVLTAYWKRPYDCPPFLALKPQHGYRSRVIKDGFPAAQYTEWLEMGCSDLAVVDTDINGRPRLVHGPFGDYVPHTYSLVVPIISDAHGIVHVADVIPSGLPARAKK